MKGSGDMSEGAGSPLGTIDVSLILPCRNEESSVGACVALGDEILSELGGRHEIIVVDNGSTDRSHVRALAAGARVVHEVEPGYGNACRAGLAAARGRIAVLADADGTYDLRAISTLVRMVDEGAHLALGSRLRGEIEAGAMPRLHRLGTPILTGLINRLFGTRLTDVNCGIRALDMSVHDSLALGAEGMEFASEMVVASAIEGLTISEVPVDYRRRLGGEPKLRTWRDGRRHLRLVIQRWLGVRESGRSGGSVPRLRPVAALEPSEPMDRGRFDADSFRL